MEEYLKVLELLRQLSTCSKRHIQEGVLHLLLEDKIDFVDLSNSYIKALKAINVDKDNKLKEANLCVVESFFNKKTKNKNNKDDYKHTQRCLYLCNESSQFQMNTLNTKFVYDKEFGKQMSWYERTKNTKDKIS